MECRVRFQEELSSNTIPWGPMRTSFSKVPLLFCSALSCLLRWSTWRAFFGSRAVCSALDGCRFRGSAGHVLNSHSLSAVSAWDPSDPAPARFLKTLDTKEPGTLRRFFFCASGLL